MSCEQIIAILNYSKSFSESIFITEFILRIIDSRCVTCSQDTLKYSSPRFTPEYLHSLSSIHTTLKSDYVCSWCLSLPLLIALEFHLVNKTKRCVDLKDLPLDRLSPSWFQLHICQYTCVSQGMITEDGYTTTVHNVTCKYCNVFCFIYTLLLSWTIFNVNLWFNIGSIRILKAQWCASYHPVCIGIVWASMMHFCAGAIQCKVHWGVRSRLGSCR